MREYTEEDREIVDCAIRNHPDGTGLMTYVQSILHSHGISGRFCQSDRSSASLLLDKHFCESYQKWWKPLDTIGV
jgi:hypothetical protein